MGYRSDLTEAQWELLEPLLPGSKKTPGRPLKHELRQVVNGILYVNRIGCQWRQVPSEFGSWITLYFQFKRMGERGVWDKVLTKLREQARQSAGKKATPTVAIIDSQSVKTTLKGGNGVRLCLREALHQRVQPPVQHRQGPINEFLDLSRRIIPFGDRQARRRVLRKVRVDQRLEGGQPRRVHPVIRQARQHPIGAVMHILAALRCLGIASRRSSIMLRRHPIARRRRAIMRRRHPITRRGRAIVSRRHPIVGGRHTITSRRHPIVRRRHTIVSHRHPIVRRCRAIVSRRHPITRRRRPIVSPCHPIARRRRAIMS
ncbi:MAG: transposase [Flavobacteriales bacterium]|nr:transposase [Flavobacteriales bacterium]